MKYILAIFGLFFSIAIMKYRESIGDSIGSYDWMVYCGGSYGLVVIIGVLMFFWCVATLTGTEDFFFAPIIMLIPNKYVPEGAQEALMY